MWACFTGIVHRKIYAKDKQSESWKLTMHATRKHVRETTFPILNLERIKKFNIKFVVMIQY